MKAGEKVTLSTEAILPSLTNITDCSSLLQVKTSGDYSEPQFQAQTTTEQMNKEATVRIRNVVAGSTQRVGSLSVCYRFPEIKEKKKLNLKTLFLKLRLQVTH